MTIRSKPATTEYRENWSRIFEGIPEAVEDLAHTTPPNVGDGWSPEEGAGLVITTEDRLPDDLAKRIREAAASVVTDRRPVTVDCRPFDARITIQPVARVEVHGAKPDAIRKSGQGE